MYVVGHIADQSVLHCTLREQMFFRSLIENLVDIKDHSTEVARMLKLPKNRVWLGCHHVTKNLGDSELLAWCAYIYHTSSTR